MKIDRARRLGGGDGEEGVMSVCGLSGAGHYRNRPARTQEIMRDGWLHTGDRFTRDADGFHFFRGRADDLVRTLKDFAKQALRPHKHPREVVFPETLPRTWRRQDRPAILERAATGRRRGRIRV